MNLNLKQMLRVLTNAPLGALGLRRCTSRRVLYYNRVEEGSLNPQPRWRMITQHTTGEGRAWREGEEA